MHFETCIKRVDKHNTPSSKQEEIIIKLIINSESISKLLSISECTDCTPVCWRHHRTQEITHHSIRRVEISSCRSQSTKSAEHEIIFHSNNTTIAQQTKLRKSIRKLRSMFCASGVI